jgi:hypothetical protein
MVISRRVSTRATYRISVSSRMAIDADSPVRSVSEAR